MGEPNTMSRDPYEGGPYDGYPESPYLPTDLTDEAQIVGLDPRDGDQVAGATKRANRPWGRVVALGQPNPLANVQLSVTPINTDIFPRPVIFALRVRFSLSPSGPFTPTIPLTYSGRVNIDVTESLDVKSGPSVESFIINAGNGLNVCQFVARSISVALSVPDLGPEGPPTIYVAIVATRVETADCGELTGTPNGYAHANITSVLVNTAVTELLASNPARKQLTVCNDTATAILFVAFGVASTSPALFTMKLPPGTMYQSPLGGYTGRVTGYWDQAEGDGAAALLTEGLA
jgi:hypothetical protein